MFFEFKKKVIFSYFINHLTNIFRDRMVINTTKKLFNNN